MAKLNIVEKDQKIKIIAGHFQQIMVALGLDVSDPSIRDTPKRVAKMYVNEIFAGLSDEPPTITTFANKSYNQMITMRDINIFSCCEHHFVPIHGKVHIAYIPGKQVIGLSKLIRIAQHIAAKPQIQEGMTQEIGVYLQKVLKTKNVAVLADCMHFCCSMRGARDINSSTVTTFLGGVFAEQKTKEEFFATIKI